MIWLKIFALSMSLWTQDWKIDDKAMQVKKKYPVISAVEGVVQVRTPWGPKSEEQDVKAKKGMVLSQKAKLSTEEGSRVRIELDENTGIVLMSHSKLDIPFIDLEKNEVEAIELMRGELRVESAESDRTLVKTKLNLLLPVVSEYLLYFNPDQARLELTVFKGEIKFKGLEHEDEVLLKPGQKGAFQGTVDEGEIQYDVLLQGQKVARGHLEKTKQIEAQSLGQLLKKTEIKKPEKPHLSDQAKAQLSGLCKKPTAKLNQCSWVQNGLKNCLRRRCFANGEWGDEVQVDRGLCRSKPIVQSCDY